VVVVVVAADFCYLFYSTSNSNLRPSTGVLRGVNDPLCKSLVLGLTPHGMQGVAAGAFVLTSSLGRALGPSVVALSELCVFLHEPLEMPLGRVLRGLGLWLSSARRDVEAAAAGLNTNTTFCFQTITPCSSSVRLIFFFQNTHTHKNRYHPSLKGAEASGWREGRKAAFGSTFKLWFVACFLLAGLLCVGDRDAKRALDFQLREQRLKAAAKAVARRRKEAAARARLAARVAAADAAKAQKLAQQQAERRRASPLGYSYAYYVPWPKASAHKSARAPESAALASAVAAAAADAGDVGNAGQQTRGTPQKASAGWPTWAWASGGGNKAAQALEQQPARLPFEDQMVADQKAASAATAAPQTHAPSAAEQLPPRTLPRSTGPNHSPPKSPWHSGSRVGLFSGGSPTRGGHSSSRAASSSPTKGGERGGGPGSAVMDESPGLHGEPPDEPPNDAAAAGRTLARAFLEGTKSP
jgi:hypothetical protein